MQHTKNSPLKAFEMNAVRWAVLILVNASAIPYAWSQATDSAAKNAPQLEKVMITANKRVEALETVPMSISVLSQEVMERNNVLQFDDIVNIVPTLSVNYGTQPANNGIIMRGLGTVALGQGVESDVAVVIDDIPMTQQFQAFMGLAGLDRVEILQGPQSTLYGKSSIAGAVNIITKPISESPKGEFSLYKTNDMENRASGTFSTRVNEHWAYRISGASNNYAGNILNIYDNSHVDGSLSKTVMGKLLWQPTEKIDVELSPRYNQSVVNCCLFVPTGFTAANGASLNNIYWQGVTSLPASKLFAGVPVGPGNTTVNEDYPTGMSSTTKGTGLKVTWALDNGATLMSVSSVSNYLANDYRDQDFSASNILGALVNSPPTVPAPTGGNVQNGVYNIQASTQEIRYTSPDEGKFRYVSGLWYSESDYTHNFVRGVANVLTSPTGTNPTNPVGLLGQSHVRNQAVFGQATYEFAPSYTFLFGGRYGREINGANLDFFAPWTPSAAVPYQHLVNHSSGEDAITTKMSLSKALDKNSMVYVLSSTGYKGRAYDFTSTSVSLNPVASETGRNLEVGFKGNYLNNRLTFNASAWNTKFSNYQLQRSFTNALGVYSTVIDSIPSVQSKGVAFDVNALATPTLLLNGSIAFTNATIGDWTTGPCAAGSTGPYSPCTPITVISGGKPTTVSVQDLTGASMPNAPKIKLNLGGQYDIILKDRSYDAFVNANIRYQSYEVTTTSQDPGFSVAPFSITNVGFGVRDRAKTFKFSLFVNNLFNKNYALTGFNGMGTYKTTGSVTGVTSTSWTPARDAFRYIGAKLDYYF
jgi:iron complex outermembrane recepter protein